MLLKITEPQSCYEDQTAVSTPQISGQADGIKNETSDSIVGNRLDGGMADTGESDTGGESFVESFVDQDRDIEMEAPVGGGDVSMRSIDARQVVEDQTDDMPVEARVTNSASQTVEKVGFDVSVTNPTFRATISSTIFILCAILLVIILSFVCATPVSLGETAESKLGLPAEPAAPFETTLHVPVVETGESGPTKPDQPAGVLPLPPVNTDESSEPTTTSEPIKLNIPTETEEQIKTSQLNNDICSRPFPRNTEETPSSLERQRYASLETLFARAMDSYDRNNQ